MSIDSEHWLFRTLLAGLFYNTERSVYNGRKRKLFSYIERIKEKLLNAFTEFEDYFILDSMPLAICKLSGSSRSKIC